MVVLFVLLAACWTVALARMWGGGFTGGDEGFTASARFRFGGVWQASKAMAQGHGRFYQLIVYPLAQIPYLIDDLRWTNALRIVSSGLTVACFAIFVQAFLGSQVAITSGFTLLLVQNMSRGGYNPFNSLPLWFNTGMALLFAALYFYTRAVRQNRVSATAAVFFFLSLLSYEAMLVYAIAFPMIWLANTAPKSGDAVSPTAWWVCGSGLAICGAVALYLLLYVAFRIAYPPSYAGASGLSWTTFSSFASAVWRLSINGIFLGLDWNVPFSASAAALVATAGAGILFSRKVGARRDEVHAALIASGIAFFVFSPNIVFGLTQRYRDWEEFYIGNYYSAFAIALLLGFLMSRALSCKRCQPMAGALLLVVTTIGYQSHIHSAQFFAASRVDALRWRVADALGQTLRERGEWSGLVTICSSTFKLDEDPYGYWSTFVSSRAKRPIAMVDSGKKTNCDAVLVFQGGRGSVFRDGIQMEPLLR